MTADELEALPDDGNFYELVRGELICMAPSAYLPGAVVGRTMGALAAFVYPRNLGDLGSADTGFRLEHDPDTVRAPDIWFVRAGRVPIGDAAAHFYRGPPDLAVEVLSPTDRYRDVMAKVRDYLAAGTPLVWVIDPLGRSAAVFRGGGAAQLLGEDGILDGGEVLPEFSVSLRELLPAAP
jgi:Uma2 family endonuclease